MRRFPLSALTLTAMIGSPSLLGAHDVPGEHPHEHGDELIATAFHNEVRINERDGYRYIEANGIPEHATGNFPNRGNPNSIQPQRYQYRVTLTPRAAPQTTPLQHQPFGVAVNGVPFDPGTAEFWQRDPRSGWNYDALSGKINLGIDQNQAHVQPSGAYHYHGIPTGLVNTLKQKQREPGMVMVGYAADGFPVYAVAAHQAADDPASPLKVMKSSYRLKSGTRPSGPGGRYDGTFVQDWEYVAGAGDLDECNGRTGVTPESPQGTYYYVLTDEYPFIPRDFRGTPDPSFSKRGPGGPGGPPDGPSGRGPRNGPGPGGPGPGGPPPFEEE